MRRLPKIVADTEVGREVDVIVWRDGEKITLQVSVGQLDDDKIASANGDDNEPNGSSKVVDIDTLGMSVAAINDDVRERFDLAEDSHGVIVVAVENGGQAAEKGMRPGDLIIEVSKKTINKPSEIQDRIKEARKAGRKSILLLVEAQAGLRYVGLNISKE
jgi:serine protease Do